MTHAKGFELLEKQLLDLHKSAQTMSNRYCAQPFQTLLVTNPIGTKVSNPIGKVKMKTEDDNNELKKKIEEMSQELKTIRNTGEREVNQLKKLLEESYDGRAG